VVHLTVGAGGGGVTKVTNDGADKLRNIERLEFSDGLHTVNEFIPSIPVRNQLPAGTVTISGTPVIGSTLTAAAILSDPDAKSGSQTVTHTTYQWEYQDPARAKWVPITGATSSTLKVADFEVGLPIRVVASYVDAKGYTESITSAQTALVTTAPGVNTAPFVVPQQGQVGLPDTIVLDNVPVNLFLPVTTVFGDAQTPANALGYKVALANGASLSTIGLNVDMSGIATNGAIRITGTLKAGSTGPFDIQVSATDSGPGTPLTITDTFTLTVMHASPGSLAVVNGSLQDGFIAGATVFMDSNGDGLRQSFEAQTVTDATGHFSLAGKPGSLVAFGGPGAVDIATLLPFDGIYKAPVGSTVMTPLTTILSEGLEQGASLTDVQTVLRSALRLAPGVDITRIDPIAAMANPDPVQKALGIHLFVTASQILNTVALLQGASPNAAPLTDITTLLLSGKVVDLTDPATVNDLVAATGLFGGFADDAAKIVLASNTLLAAKADPGFSTLDILTGVSAASIVAKGMTAAALGQAFTLAEMDTVATHFSGDLLAAEVTNATHRVGDVNGDGTGDASQAPPVRLVALVSPTSSVVENTNVQNGLKVADIVIVDLDASTDVVSVAGRDASSFAVRDGILGKELWYVGGNLDYESGKTAYDVTVSVSNPANTGTAPFTASMTMTVLNVNEAPVAAADSYTTAEDNVLSVSAANGVLKNDTDPDNIPGGHQDPMSAVLVSGPAHGTLVLNADGSFVYTPDANFNSGYDPATKQVSPGPDSFTYVASDGQLSSAPVTVTLGVTPVDDAPTGSPGLAAALAGANSVTLTTSPGTLSDVDGIPPTGPGAVAYTWERSATGLGPWTTVAATTATTLALTVPATATAPAYYDAVATYTDLGGTRASVVSATKAEVGTRGADLLADTVGTGAASQAIAFLAGLAGNDTYVVTHDGVTVMENTAGGSDTVETSLATYVLDDNVENLSTILPTHGGTNAVVDYSWTGNALANTITAGAGNDWLDGGAGADRMVGGLGNDTYAVDNAGDVVVEGLNAGIDTVRSAIAYTLGANLENLTLTGIASINGTGNAADNVLTGNDGNNQLDGAAGADRMVGGLGNDTYIADNAGDVVVEDANAGIDTVLSSVSYTLGANVENLTLTGFGGISGTGNVADNVLTGNAGDNLLDGGAGADRMVGGSGDDTYVIDNAGDVVVENASGGIDTVLSGISYTLGANVENLTLTGTGDISATGNAAANILVGNDGDNQLDGGVGADRMVGGLGNDIYLIDNVGDVIVEGVNGGIDGVVSSISYALGANLENLTLSGFANINGTGNAADNSLTGNAGINILDGGVGADRMAGGAGNDTYVVDNAGDVVIENGAAGTDTVRTSLNAYTLTANVENLAYTGIGAFGGTGNAGANTLTGGAGADTLDGVRNTDGSFDTLVGGAGNDTYLVHSLNDVVTEALGGGTDTVKADVTFKLAANLENLTLIGAANIDGTGTAGNNTISGNTGANILTGAGGNDTFVFGPQFGKDTVTDFSTGTLVNHDTIDLSALGLTFTGTAAQQFAAFLSANVTDVGTGGGKHAQIHVGTDTIDLTGVLKAGLIADDFRFH
jgi:Ca2+-binding RTX toxin-like protein